MRAKRRVLQEAKSMREKLEVKQQKEHYKFSRLTIPELKTLETFVAKIGEGNDMSALEYEELEALEKLLEKAADSKMPDVEDHIQDYAEEPHDF